MTVGRAVDADASEGPPRGGGGAARALLADGRWHFQHGPIDLVIGADGDSASVAQAHEACWKAFQPLLGSLTGERALLYRDMRLKPQPQGPVAMRMVRACEPYADQGIFITAMAAVAGSVADELIGCYRRPGVSRAFINNGGDIAFHLAPGHSYRVGVVSRADTPSIDADLELCEAIPVRGIATSGWRGRSFSLGIADSVTVLAHQAAVADAAATVIANAVDAQHPAIVRRRADELRDDTDLGERLVTVDVGRLPANVVRAALERGLACARRLQSQGLIAFAALSLAGHWCATAPMHASAVSALEQVA